MASDASPYSASRSLLASMMKNVAWLAGGKGFGAVCSLAYLAILTRSLGLKDFGHFSLIFGTSQALIALVGFQTWRVVVRFGVDHVHNEDWAAFGRLSVIAGFLDVVGAIFGTAVAYVIFYRFADALDINPQLVDLAFWFNVAAMWALVSAPTGIVRALNRFDVAVYIEGIVPLGRLIAAVVIAATQPSLMLFLIAWAAIDLIEAALYWIAARYLCPEAIRLGHLRMVRRARDENPGMIRFFCMNYANTSVDAVFRHGPLLAVGYFVGTSAAGVYRLAHQLAQGLSKLSSLLSRAAYAEISRARVSATTTDFRRLVAQTTKLAGAGGALIILLVLALGGQIMTLLGGEAFRAGYVILIPLTIAGSLELASVAFDPVLHSTGRIRLSLIARLLAVGATATAILLLVGSFGIEGVAWSVTIGALVAYLTMGTIAHATMRKMDRAERQAD